VTVIAAIHDPRTGRAWMQADTRAVAGSAIVSSTVQKVARHGLALIGGSGPAAITGFVRRRAPDLEPGQDVEDYLERLSDAWVEWSAHNGLDTVHDGRTFREGDLLVATPYGLWGIGGDRSIAQHDGYMAIGSGYCEAMGALYATRACDPEFRLRVAIEAACLLDTGCAGMGELFEVQAPMRIGEAAK
jgi:ATP-dependent protease HslVU (ClpYQ) peptidase subunit